MARGKKKHSRGILWKTKTKKQTKTKKGRKKKNQKMNKIVSGTTKILINELKKKGIDISEHKEMIEKNIHFCIITVLVSVML